MAKKVKFRRDRWSDGVLNNIVHQILRLLLIRILYKNNFIYINFCARIKCDILFQF